jgi:hypothetical protein
MNKTVIALTTGFLLYSAQTLAVAQQAFKTPEDAASALAAAAKAGSVKELLTVLGPDARDILSSGDAVADAQTRREFVTAYEAGHRIAMDGDSKAILIIGREDFPLPIPLARKAGIWRFDSAGARQEILARRIGRNELSAIQACQAYVDAQREYAEQDRTGAGANTYAQRIVSRPGKKDGLYWRTNQGEHESPLGPLFAEASAQGYRSGDVPAPYVGYYFRILTRQGSAASSGEIDYVVGGKMIGGFALVAYPAEYGNSGVMTFIVNHSGAVFQKDLGPQTGTLAATINSFNPDQSWERVSEESRGR